MPERKDNRRKLTKVQALYIDADYEARPASVRLNARRGAKRGALMRYAKRVLARLQENIRTAMNGRWTPVQWGPRAGMPALQGTEGDWRIVRTGPNSVQIRPLERKARRWRGHTRGATIVPRKKKFLRIRTEHGPIFLKKVKLPKRDPRPTSAQLLSLSRS